MYSYQLDAEPTENDGHVHEVVAQRVAVGRHQLRGRRTPF